MKDMFGDTIAVGQHLLYADFDENEKPMMCVYRVVELDTEVCVAEWLDGTGNWFYLEDLWKRAVIIGDNRSMYTLASCYKNSVIH